MLLSTFKHLSGIGPKKEKQLWYSGILTWKDFDRQKKQLSQLPGFIRPEQQELSESWEAYRCGDTAYFAHKLPPNEYYRIALTYPNETLFLDIETTGLSWYYDHITLVGWSMGEKYKVYIKGDDETELFDAFRSAKALVTFNGSLFDLKFLYNEFPVLPHIQSHIDLRFLSRRVGLKGGQKFIEKEIGVSRNNEIQEMEGESAPLLWYKFCAGDLEALKKLIAYNQADVYGMKVILDEVIKRLLVQDKIPRKIWDIRPFSYKITDVKWSNGDNYLHQVYKKNNINDGISIYDLLPSDPIKIIGIDLTGNPERASGWAFLEGKQVVTRQLLSDEEIITKSLETKPDLVSIDSPLSLPKGRTTVFNDDPGRKNFGIMRHCERQLKRRGINVYPCLIDSMQKLTKRGIELADKFRKLGIPVIESYPGAAQDIMKIPRKRANLEYLKKGLFNFGIEGDYTKNKVSHDELDAITSALVGLFFWSGRFERLGNVEEDYLIIPDMNVNATNWLKRQAIGFCGPIASGKTTASHYLEKNGFIYKRFSQTLSELLKEEGIEPTRYNLQEFGDKINQDKGQRWLAQKMLSKIPEEDNIVIDGLRFPEDIAFMKEFFGPGFLCVFISASYEVRKNRYIGLGYTKDEFEEASKHNVERKVNELQKLAHMVLENFDGVFEFQNKLNEIIQQKSELCL